jgi:acetolactate synthase regulatory subunit
MSAYKSEQSIACFSVSAQAGPAVLPRILDYFAKRGLVPDYLKATRSGDALTVDVRMTGMELELARYIGRCLDRIFEIDSVFVSEKRYADVA